MYELFEIDKEEFESLSTRQLMEAECLTKIQTVFIIKVPDLNNITSYKNGRRVHFYRNNQSEIILLISKESTARDIFARNIRYQTTLNYSRDIRSSIFLPPMNKKENFEKVKDLFLKYNQKQMLDLSRVVNFMYLLIKCGIEYNFDLSWIKTISQEVRDATFIQLNFDNKFVLEKMIPLLYKYDHSIINTVSIEKRNKVLPFLL